MTARHGKQPPKPPPKRNGTGKGKTVTAKVGGKRFGVTAQVTLPAVTKTVTKSGRVGPVRVTAKATVPVVPGRGGGRYTLTKPQAIGKLEQAMKLAGEVVDELRQAANAARVRAAELRQDAEQHQAEHDRLWEDAKAAQLVAASMRDRAAELDTEAGRADAEVATHRREADATAGLADRAEQAGAERGRVDALRAEAAGHIEAAGEAEQRAKELRVEADDARRRGDQDEKDADQIHVQALGHKEERERLDGEADAAEQRGQFADEVGDEVEQTCSRVGDRLVAAKGMDEGAAAALDDAARLLWYVCDRVDSVDFTGGSTSTDRIRHLAKESRQ